jgi:hypothetical protein
LECWSVAVSTVDDAPDIDDVYGDIREAVQFDDGIESGGWGVGGSVGCELVECRCDDIGCDGDGEFGIPVYGLERGLFSDGQSCAGDRDGRAEGIDGDIWEAGGVYGGERAFGSSGIGGREHVYDAEGVQLAAGDGTYDWSDVASVEWDGDAVFVSELG